MNSQSIGQDPGQPRSRLSTSEVALLVVVIIGSLLMLLNLSWGHVVGQVMVWGTVFAVMVPGFLCAARIRVLYVTCGELVILMLTLALWRFLSAYWAVDPQGVFLQAVKTLVLCAFIVSVASIVGRMSPESLRRFVHIMVPVLLYATVLHVVVSLAHKSAWHLIWQEAGKGIIITAWGTINTAGAIVMMIGCLNWILMLDRDMRMRRVGWIMWAVSWALLIAMRCRSSQAGFLLSNVAVLMMISCDRRRRALISLLCAIGMIGATMMFQTNQVALNERALSLHGRTVLFRAAVTTIVGQYGLVGIGSGSWDAFAAFQGLGSVILPTDHVSGELIRGGVHNALLQTWMEDGFIGLIVYLGVHLLSWRRVRCAQRRPRTQSTIPLCGFLTAVFVRNLAESNGVLFGLINNSAVFMSWLIFLLVFQYGML